MLYLDTSLTLVGSVAGRRLASGPKLRQEISEDIEPARGE
jgi:hypothetical protein